MIKAISIASIAANETKETWKVRWSTGTCFLKLSYDASDLSRKAKVKSPCKRPLRSTRSFAFASD